MPATRSSGGNQPHGNGPAVALTRHDAHRYESAGADDERCSVCGELEVHIRHHPTRVRAALLVRGLDPDDAR